MCLAHGGFILCLIFGVSGANGMLKYPTFNGSRVNKLWSEDNGQTYQFVWQYGKTWWKERLEAHHEGLLYSSTVICCQSKAVVALEDLMGEPGFNSVCMMRTWTHLQRCSAPPWENNSSLPHCQKHHCFLLSDWAVPEMWAAGRKNTSPDRFFPLHHPASPRKPAQGSEQSGPMNNKEP